MSNGQGVSGLQTKTQRQTITQSKARTYAGFFFPFLFAVLPPIFAETGVGRGCQKGVRCLRACGCSLGASRSPRHEAVFFLLEIFPGACRTGRADAGVRGRRRDIYACPQLRTTVYMLLLPCAYWWQLSIPYGGLTGARTPDYDDRILGLLACYYELVLLPCRACCVVLDAMLCSTRPSRNQHTTKRTGT